MKQNNNNISNISHLDYDPSEDPKVIDTIGEELERIRERFMPGRYMKYQKQVLFQEVGQLLISLN